MGSGKEIILAKAQKKMVMGKTTEMTGEAFYSTFYYYSCINMSLLISN